MLGDESVSFFFRSSVVANWDGLSLGWGWSKATEAGLAVLVDSDHLEEFLDGLEFLIFLLFHHFLQSINQSQSIFPRRLYFANCALTPLGHFKRATAGPSLVLDTCVPTTTVKGCRRNSIASDHNTVFNTRRERERIIKKQRK